MLNNCKDLLKKSNNFIDMLTEMVEAIRNSSSIKRDQSCSELIAELDSIFSTLLKFERKRVKLIREMVENESSLPRRLSSQIHQLVAACKMYDVEKDTLCQKLEDLKQNFEKTAESVESPFWFFKKLFIGDKIKRRLENIRNDVAPLFGIANEVNPLLSETYEVYEVFLQEKGRLESPRLERDDSCCCIY